MIGYWGYLNFETNDDWISYPSNIERTAKGRWQTYYPADGGRAKRVFLGPDIGTITFDMYFDQRFNSNIRDILAEFVIWVNQGYAAPLVIGTKAYGYNLWVCTQAVEKFREVIHNGIIVSAIVSVTMEEY